MTTTGKIAPKFWEYKKLTELNEAEWEALCDGCGKCCFRKFVRGYGKRKKIYFTRIACDLLDLKTGQCSDYCNRFQAQPKCTKLTLKNLPQFFDWLPKTCAYRLIYEGKSLPDWHPLIIGNDKLVRQKIIIKNAVHEKNIIDWFEWVIDEV